MLKLNTGIKISDKIKEAVDNGYSVTAIAKHLGISRPTYYKRMLDNSWTDRDRETLRLKKIID